MTFAQAVARFAELQPGAGEAEAREALSVVSSVDPRATQLVVASRMYEDFDIERTLHGVACAILLLVGEVELGGLVRDQDVAFLTACAPSARVVRILGGGHGIVSGEPAETVHAEIIDFSSSFHLLAACRANSKLPRNRSKPVGTNSQAGDTASTTC